MMPMRVSVPVCTGQASGPAHRRASRCVPSAGLTGEHRDDQATRVQGDPAGQQSGGILRAQGIVETGEHQDLVPGAVGVSGQERAIAYSPSAPTAGVHHRHARRTNSRTPRCATSSAVRGTPGPHGRMPCPELEAHERKRVTVRQLIHRGSRTRRAHGGRTCEDRPAPSATGLSTEPHKAGGVVGVATAPTGPHTSCPSETRRPGLIRDPHLCIAPWEL